MPTLPALFSKDGVGRDRRPVSQGPATVQARARKELLERLAVVLCCASHRIHHAAEVVIGGGGSFEHVHAARLVENDGVGECPSHIDTDILSH